jgi:hypothetical protein
MTTIDRLERVAVELVVRIRDDDPDAVNRWLTSQLPDPIDWYRLAFVLAAAVPDDRTWRQLTAWAYTRGPCSPSGHRRRNERVCDDCRAWDRDRKHAERDRLTTSSRP